MQEQKEHYELVFIISGSLAEDQHPQAIAEIKAILEKYDGQVSLSADLGRRKLAYPIDHLKHGFYHVWEFDIMPFSLNKVEQEFRLNKNILRHLVIRKKVQTEAAKAKEQKRQAGKANAELKAQDKAKAETVKKTENTKGKVSLEDLDKKLDELLDEKII